MSSNSSISRRTVLGAVGAGTAAAAVGAGELLTATSAEAVIPGPSSYTASWSSVDQHPPAPEWFQDAKFGIYYHWGVFSVPAFGSEWYPRNMYNAGSNENRHHISTYGDPSAWPYQNFINGARDKAGNFVQFAPKLVSAGGAWDPNAWAQMFADAGAKFAGPVAEHHDGYSMWNSTINEWNSVKTGPKLDLLKLHADAIRAKGLKLFVSLHTVYNFTGYFQWVPTQSSTTLKKLFGQLGDAAEYQLWYDKLKEVIDGYQPDIIYQDFNVSRVPEAQRLAFLSYYYNRAVAWDKEVLATYKDGFNTRGEVQVFERGGPAAIQTPYWLAEESVSSSTWCYTNGMGYYATNALLHGLIDRVSKSGNFILNIAPMADGTIPSAQQSILQSIGDYLKRFGESIYNTRAWSVYGEGPTAMGGGTFVAPRAGTNRDFRFTRSKDSKVLYITVLGWPGSSATISSITSSRLNLSSVSAVQLLGSTAGTYIDLPRPTQDSGGLHLTLPSSAPYSAPAYVIRLVTGPIPSTTTSPPPSSTPPSSTPPSSTPPTSTPPSSTPPTSTPPAGRATATYKSVGSWPGGFQAEVTVTAGSAAISGWTVTWTFPSGQTITQLWNGSVTQSGANVTVTNAAYNGALGAGASTTFGFIGAASGANTAPSGLTVTAG
jgi:alpha-L-fucosidase